MSFEVAGKLYKIFPEEAKSDRFKVREFVIEIMDGTYPQMVKFQLAQERCQLIDKYSEGDEVTVHFDLRGREWQGKFFTTLNCWRLEGAQSEGGAKAANAPRSPKNNESDNSDGFPTVPPPAFEQSTNFDDDLPF